jgi:plastocyanin
MRRRVGFIAVGCVAGAAIALPAAAGARTKTVFAGPPPSAEKVAAKVLGKPFLGKYSPGINDFFLHRVTVNAGDTVSFINAGFHTIDLPGKSGEDLPLIVPAATKVSGADDAAGHPFWFNGLLPNLNLNPALFAGSKATTYDGSARVDSGLPPDSGNPKPFNVKFTKPGVYKYFCDVHPGMVGYVVVKAKGKPVPSRKQDAAALAGQLRTDLAALKKLAKTKVTSNHVSLGEAGSGGTELYAMFPARLRVKAGTVLTFSMSQHSREVHTATFGPSKYLNALSNGLFSAPAPTAESLYPSSPVQPILLKTTSHGNGFANIGAVDTDPTTPQIPASGKIKFTAPGTYNFICLIHTQMQGTIVVTK